LALAVLTVWAALLLPAWLFLLAESIWEDARRSLLAMGLALCSALWFVEPFGLSASALADYFSCGPSAYALTLSLAGMACAGHALRHGLRPWVGLCGLCLGFALLADFQSAWPAALAVALAALAPTCAAHARPRLLLAIVVCALPALVQWRLLGLTPWSDEWLHSRGAASAALPWFFFGALAAVLVWRALAQQRRAVLVLCSAACVIGLAVLRFEPAFANLRTASSLVLFSAAIACAGWWAVDGPLFGQLRRFARLAVLAIALAGLVRLAGSSKSSWASAGIDHELLGESALALEPIGPEASSQDLRAALAALRSDPRLREDRAVLLACPVHNPYRLTRDLPEQALAASAGIALYGDARSSLLLTEPEFQPRLEQLLQLFRHPGDFDPTLFARLNAAGSRTAVALEREEDRAMNPALGGKLQRMGFVPWKEFGAVRLYLGPLASAARYAESK
jgi:hypothetical protein